MTVLFHGRFTCGWCRTAWRHSFNPTTGETMIHWLRWHRHVMENGWIFPLRKLYGDLPTHRIHGAGIYANIGGILMVNVAIYSIHGSYGWDILRQSTWWSSQKIHSWQNSIFPTCQISDDELDAADAGLTHLEKRLRMWPSSAAGGLWWWTTCRCSSEKKDTWKILEKWWP